MSRGSPRLPGYAELQELGAGAQGRVVLARHETSGLHVAIKYLASGLLDDPHAQATFRSEAELLRRVINPHVARILGYLESPQGAAIIMEAVPGRSLRAVLDGLGEPLAPEAALTILKGSLKGLAAAHAVGVVHRDYKPANVLVQSDGQSKLIDFGVAVLSGQGGVMGTPAYMAPEQWQGDPASPATDIYAATCVFYECVTGHKPYGAATQEGLRSQHIAAPVPLEDLPEPLRPLVLQGMAKSPGQRQWNVTAFISELEAVATANYGSDWERRGLITLGAATAVLTATLPLGLLGGALSPGAVIGSGTQAAGETGRALGSKGILAKIGGAKGAGGAAAGTAAAVMVTFFLWPEAPGVGGTSSGDYRGYFSRPRIVLANSTVPDGDNNASPLISERITISPARVKAGTRVRMESIWHVRTPWGLQYLAPGNFRCHSPNSERGDAYHQSYGGGIGAKKNHSKDPKKPNIWLYPVGDEPSGSLPTNTPVRLQSGSVKEDKQKKKYDNNLCAWTFNGTSVQEFVIPPTGILEPGRYKVSQHHPVKIVEVRATVNNRVTTINPDLAGARVEGSLPTLEVLAP